MSEITIHPRRDSQKSNGNGGAKKGTTKGGRRPNYNTIHRNLLPVDIHPLPVLIPHNPLSIVTIALSYLIQVLAPPKRAIYTGYFSSATSSIHITEEETQRALWEQGFFGKGSLSRSEPTWLEIRKRAGSTAEENTDSRRKERRQFKMERARAELNAMEQDMAKGSEVTAEATSLPGTTPDTAGSLPTPMLSTADVVKANEHDFDGIAGVLNSTQPPLKAPEGCAGDPGAPLLPKLLNLKEDDSPTPSAPIPPPTSAPRELGGRIEGFEEWKKTVDAHGLPTPPPTSTSSETSQNEQHVRPTKRLQRQKTVRFSPTIEAREFDLSSPVISPIKAPGSSPAETPIDENETLETAIVSSNPLSANLSKNQEHLQISLEEAFFLSYALGVLEVLPSSDADSPMPTTSLLSLFRRHSYFPARSLSIRPEPDDPFLLSYAAYHHYRSMGWVVRSGVKFGVDYLLYNRGPVFSHAEFAVIVLPSYRDGRERETKHWWWLHGINRVQAQVHKSLVLCYVDVPDMMPKAADGQVDIGETLALYKVRDVNVRRWTPNRNRD